MKFTFETKNKTNFYGDALLLFYILLPFIIEKINTGIYNLLSGFGYNFPVIIDAGLMSIIYCIVIISIIVLCNRNKLFDVDFNLVNKKMSFNKLIVFILCSEGLNMLSAMFNVIRNSNTETTVVSTGSTISITILFYTCLIGPIVEELIFRGFLLNSIKKYNSSFAIIFTAILFGIMHGNITQALPSIFMGILWGYVASEYGIKYSIILHMFANTIVCLISMNGTYMTFLMIFLVIAMLVCIVVFIKKFKIIKNILVDAIKNANCVKSVMNLTLIIWIMVCIVEIAF